MDKQLLIHECSDKKVHCLFTDFQFLKISEQAKVWILVAQ